MNRALPLVLAVAVALPLAAADIRGLYLYTEHPEKDLQTFQSALRVPGIDGVTILVGWKSIEPSRHAYGWQPGVPGVDLLGELLAASAGKKIDLAIRAGQDTPDWLFAPVSQGGAGAAPLQFQVAPLEGDVPSGTCNAVKIAAPWDPAFLAEWDAMLAALAQHLRDIGAYDSVLSVRLTGINRTTAELRLPAELLTKPCVTNSVETWLQAGYRPAKLLQAWDAVTDSFKKYFPDKVFTLPIIPSASGNGTREYPFPPIDDNGCPFAPPWPTSASDPNFFATSCVDRASNPGQFPPSPDQDAPLLDLASRKFPGRLVVAYQNLDLRFPAQPYVLYAANTWGTGAAFQTNDYIGPFQQAACSVVSGQFGSCDATNYLALLELGIHPCRTNSALCSGSDTPRATYIEVLPPDALAFPGAILQAHEELTTSSHRRAARH